MGPRARRLRQLSLEPPGGADLGSKAEDMIEVSEADPVAALILSAIPLQPRGYQTALLKGVAIDQPCNPAKSATLE